MRRLPPGARFLVVGATTVAIDAVVYRLMLWAGVATVVAKPVGFVVGAVFAYFANWRFTFGERRHTRAPLAFAAVYLGALAVNTVLNELLLNLLGRDRTGTALAFLGATAASATWNFFGMARFVFSVPRRPDTASAARE